MTIVGRSWPLVENFGPAADRWRLLAEATTSPQPLPVASEPTSCAAIAGNYDVRSGGEDECVGFMQGFQNRDGSSKSRACDRGSRIIGQFSKKMVLLYRKYFVFCARAVREM